MRDPARWEILHPLETHVTPSDGFGRIGLRVDCDLRWYGDGPKDSFQPGPDQHSHVSRILDFRIEDLAATCRIVLAHIEKTYPPENP